jgi:hypothetical protein
MSMMLVILLATLMALGLGAYLWLRGRSLPEVPYYFIRCGRCAQKIRYLASRAGQEAGCPRCRGRCVLPLEAPGRNRVPDPPSAYRRRYSRNAPRSTLLRPSRRAS